MNNNFFAVTRYLRDKGVDCHLFLLSGEFSHFHPSLDTYDLDYQNYTHSLDWGSPAEFAARSTGRYADALEDFDVLIGCGSVPAYLDKAGRHLDIFIPYGDDLYHYPFFTPGKNPARFYNNYVFSRHQRNGIRRARYINADTMNDTVDRIFERLDYRGKRIRRGFPMLYTPIYDPATIAQYYDRSHWHHEFAKIRADYELLVFHQSRHFWDSSRLDWKGNERLIRGFARFAKQPGSPKAALIMLEYGTHVARSKQLVNELGITENVKWFPQMARKDLMVGLSMADIGTGQFGHSWLSCGSIYESLALAKPILHYRQDALYQEAYPELYPLMNARMEDEIAALLTDYALRPEYYKQMGAEGREWFLKYAIEAPLESYMEILSENKETVS